MEKKEKQIRKGVGINGSHNASMRAILRTCCPMRQDVRTPKQATLVGPGDFRRGLSVGDVLVGREDDLYYKHKGYLSYCLPESSGLGPQPCH